MKSERNKKKEPMTTPLKIYELEVPNPVGWIVTHGQDRPLVTELIFSSKPDATEWVKRNPTLLSHPDGEVTLTPVTSYEIHSQVTEMSLLRKRVQNLAAKCEELVSERNRYKARCRMVERDLERWKRGGA